jgi:hypothetical protein
MHPAINGIARFPRVDALCLSVETDRIRWAVLSGSCWELAGWRVDQGDANDRGYEPDGDRKAERFSEQDQSENNADSGAQVALAGHAHGTDRPNQTEVDQQFCGRHGHSAL